MAESAILGGGWLEHLRQWLSPASSPEPSGLEPPGAASRARALPQVGAELGHCQDGALTTRLRHVRQAQLHA